MATSRTAETKDMIVKGLESYGRPVEHANASGFLADYIGVPADGVYKDAMKAVIGEGKVEAVVKGRRTQRLALTNGQGSITVNPLTALVVDPPPVSKKASEKKTSSLAKKKTASKPSAVKSSAAKKATAAPKMTYTDHLVARRDEIDNEIAAFDTEINMAETEQDILRDERAMISDLLEHMSQFGPR